MKQPQGNSTVVILLVATFFLFLIGAGYTMFKTTTDTDNVVVTKEPVTETRYIQFSAFRCESVLDSDDPRDCFVSKNEVSPWKDINITGGYSSKGPQRPYTALGITITPCSSCDQATTIDFIAASRSLGCSIDVKADPNNFGTFNQTIFPTSDPYELYNLEAREHIQVPIAEYTAQGLYEFMIFPNPAGCDMDIQDLYVY